MIDLYVDDVSLKKIEQKCGSQVLVFTNEAKDEAVRIPVSDEELLNMYHRLRRRCETLELIHPQNINA